MLNSTHGPTSCRHQPLHSPTLRPAARHLLTVAVSTLSFAAAAVTAGGSELREPPALFATAEGDLELRYAAPSATGSLVELGAEAALRHPPGTDRVRIRLDGELPVSVGAVRRSRIEPLKSAAPATSGCDLDWRNFGGTAQRNGVAASTGPGKPRIRWSGSRYSIIAWPVFSDGKMAFTVRQSGFQEPGGSLIVAMDRTTGEELWVRELPYEEGDWHHWIAGVDDGKVYASRAGNGASVSARLFALSANDGATLWESQDEITAGAYDGVVFAQNGDLIVGSFQTLSRIRAGDGATVWRSPRQCSVGGSCGAVMGSDQAIYVADLATGGQVLVRYDAASGQRLYESGTMPGDLVQDMPFAGSGGSVYLARTQNNPAVDHLYAFDDLGDRFELRWSVPSAWVTTSVHAVPADGTLYMIAPGDELLRLDAASGAVLASAGVLEGLSSPRMAVDTDGKLYVSDGVTSLTTAATLYGFNPDLTLRWTDKVERINIGGPSLGADGFLTVAGVGLDLRAYKNARSAPSCP